MASAYTNATGQGLGPQIVAYAARFLGVPYLWGGATPKGFDCSGLVQYVYDHFGISLPRTSQEQARVGQVVPPASIAPGDLILYNEPGEGPDSHIAIAVGGGMQIEAPQPGEHVQYSRIDWAHFDKAVRVAGAPITTTTAADVTTASLNPLDWANEIAKSIKTAMIVGPVVLAGGALIVWGMARSAGRG